MRSNQAFWIKTQGWLNACQKIKKKELLLIAGVFLLNACASHTLPSVEPLQVKETASSSAGRNYIVCADCVKYTRLKLPLKNKTKQNLWKCTSLNLSAEPKAGKTAKQGSTENVVKNPNQ